MTQVDPVAVAARTGTRVVGLALGAVPSAAPATAELLSLYVLPDSRRQGLGTALAAGLEDALARRGCRSVRTNYMTGKPGTEAVERILRNRGWSPPRARTVILKFTVAQAMTTEWYGRYRLRAGFEVFLWKDLTEAEARELRRSQEESSWIPEDLEPWRFDRRGFEQASSIGARLEGRIVGWVINQPIDDQTVRFACAHVRSDLARLGRIVPLYSESIRRLAATQYVRCTLATPARDGGMAEFVRRRCAPFASFLGETRDAEKQLEAPREET